jgi:hypothetical protein
VLQISGQEIERANHAMLLRLFPQMLGLIEHLFDCVPDADLPLLVGGDYPDWVRAQVERRLKNKWLDRLRAIRGVYSENRADTKRAEWIARRSSAQCDNHCRRHYVHSIGCRWLMDHLWWQFGGR